MVTQSHSYEGILEDRNTNYSRAYGNLEEYELELKRYKKNGDDERKKSLALKASTSFDDDEDEWDENESKEEEDEMALLSKKLQRILR